ncbi:hypothetical protein GLOTRDRAFT_101763, partial [Gloeophyllum trabeum ATCC 11539]
MRKYGLSRQTRGRYSAKGKATHKVQACIRLIGKSAGDSEGADYPTRSGVSHTPMQAGSSVLYPTSRPTLHSTRTKLGAHM